ncbi:MAG TPA: T9SS type A sorting domain-containing protein [Bacteroidales bacterium]|nr:T9SS type A sorting domain-containing protein [Bacteroidales bacterium]
MKKVLFLSAALVFGLSTFAQFKPAKVSEQFRNVKAIKPAHAVQETMNFSTVANYSVAPAPSKAMSEVQIGNTRYDLQSNGSVQNRIYLYDDGTVGATFTFGLTETAFADRGTGYNYFDGSAWGPNPTAKIELNRSGWPSYAPLGAGEIVVSHNGSTGLLVNKRDVKGTGTWSQSVLVGPACSNGTTALLWPRMITSGNTVHIIACTDQATAPAVWTYEGLALAIVYIRSTDGGATWDAPRILPGMDSASIVTAYNAGFGGDSYGWANPVGDTVAFVVGDSWQGLFYMKSTDGGTTWTKNTVLDVPFPTTFPTAKFCTTDGYQAIALDKNGKAHIAFGRTRVYMSAATTDSSFYYPYTDGLVYWNADMPALDTTKLGDLDALNTAGQLIGYMEDYNGDSTINFPTPASADELAVGKYFNSLSSFPQIHVDADDNLFISYSQCREDKIDANGTKLYRHLFLYKDVAGDVTNTDLTADIIHDYDECVFGSMSQTSNDKIHIIYQADDTPGLAVRGDETAYGDNFIYYVAVDKIETGVNENEAAANMNIYPNPTSEYSYIDLNLQKASKVNVTITNLVGQEVFNKEYGQLSAGNHMLTVNVNNLNSGIYFYTVQSGNERITKKVIIK